jgi:hypothetical protein
MFAAEGEMSISFHLDVTSLSPRTVMSERFRKLSTRETSRSSSRSGGSASCRASVTQLIPRDRHQGDLDSEQKHSEQDKTRSILVGISQGKQHAPHRHDDQQSNSRDDTDAYSQCRWKCARSDDARERCHRVRQKYE